MFNVHMISNNAGKGWGMIVT